MSEIQSVANFELIKYFTTGYVLLVSLINALMIYIFRNVKKDIEELKKEQQKDIEELKKEQQKDHDRLNGLFAEHNIYHPKNGNPK